MAGANINTVISFFKDNIQTQQNAAVQGLVSTASSTGESKTDFGDYMKANVSETNTQAKTAKSMEKQSESTAISNTARNKALKPKEVKTVGGEAAKEKADALIQVMQEQETIKETVNIMDTKNQNQTVGMALTQEMQNLFAKTEIVDEPLPDAGEGLKEICQNVNLKEGLLGTEQDLKQALEEIEQQLMQKIMEGFEVTEDELKEAMQVLAISIFDLLQTDNLKELAVYVSNEENIVSLITNGEIYDAYKEAEAVIEEISTEFLESFSVTPEELKEIVAQLESAAQENTPDIPEIVETVKLENLVSTEEMSAQSAAKLPAEPMEEAEKTQVHVEAVKNVESPPKSNEDIKVSVKNEDSAERIPELVHEAAEQTDTQQNDTFSSDAGSTGREKGTQASAKVNENQVVQTNTSYSTVVTENEVQTVVRTQQTDFEGIVRQIVEQVKVEIKPEATSMELQLNPENLGKVNLHVASKEGVITAQFFVQNETVKAAIEGQLMVFRETMNQQGVKVEAVEVSVGTGNFGRDLEQHSEQKDQEAERRARIYQHRPINLLAGMDEESMNEEELLRAHIMRESGNSVDMNA